MAASPADNSLRRLASSVATEDDASVWTSTVHGNALSDSAILVVAEPTVSAPVRLFPDGPTMASCVAAAALLATARSAHARMMPGEIASATLVPSWRVPCSTVMAPSLTRTIARRSSVPLFHIVSAAVENARRSSAIVTAWPVHRSRSPIVNSQAGRSTVHRPVRKSRSSCAASRASSVGR